MRLPFCCWAGLLPGLLLTAAPDDARSRSLPPLVLPQGVGVNIHFTRGQERDLDLIAAAGFRFIRMDFVWSSTERVRGEYDWSAYHELTDQLERRGLRALYILDYSNPLYEDTAVARNPISGREERTTASPQQPESVAAFARWAAAAYVLLLVSDKGLPKLVGWSATESRTVELPWPGVTADTVELVDGWGERPSFETALRNTGEALRWNLGPLPQYLTLRLPRRDLAAAAAWQVGPTPSLIEAGSSQDVAVPVRVTNPFSQPLAVKASLLGLHPTRHPAAGGKLEPGESQVFRLAAQTDQRWPAEIEAQVRVELSLEAIGNQPAWQGTWHEPRPFTLANPLDLQLAPIAEGYRLQVQNPARGTLEGRVRLARVEQGLRLTEAQPEVTLEVKSELRSTGVQVWDVQGRTIVETPSWSFVPLDPGPLRAVPDGDSSVAAQVRLTMTNAPGGVTAPYPKAWRLDYEFGAGWRFVRVAPTAPAGSILLEFPEALGLWVYGDRSGSALRLRVTDSAGQTFQPDGPRLDWIGWRWVEFDLKDLKSAGHWGGANDGVARGWLHLDTLLLVDSTRDPTNGTLHFAGPLLVQRDV